MGFNYEDEGSCRQSLDKIFFTPLNVPETHICFFDGKSLDPKGECRNAEAYIESQGRYRYSITRFGHERSCSDE
jgi:hypothetical protein